MKKVVAGILISLTALVGCTPVPGDGVTGREDERVRYIHDTEHKVGCWVTYGGQGVQAISCIPDKDYMGQ